MADIHSKEVRSYNMSRIRAKDTKPEMLVRRFLHANGFRFRLHVKDLPGKPDLVMPKYRTVVFVNGCFWHGHESCKYSTIPETNKEWWTNKVNATRLKDHQDVQKLRSEGWSVVSIFQCELRPRQRQLTLNNLLIYINAPPVDSLDFTASD